MKLLSTEVEVENSFVYWTQLPRFGPYFEPEDRSNPVLETCWFINFYYFYHKLDKVYEVNYSKCDIPLSDSYRVEQNMFQ